MTTVSISCHLGPMVTVGLANDTAPSGPNTDSYRTDLLTNDPTVTGTAVATAPATIVKLEGKVDAGAYIDITSVLTLDQYTWYPGALSAGSHTITIRATDSNNLPTTSSLTFTVNVPPVANAGGNQTIAEGSLATFDGSNSTDTEAPIFSYLWTLPNNSTVADAYATYTFLQDGSYPVTLAVTDTAGSVVSNTATITVTNQPPVIVTIPDQTIAEAGTASFQASFTDPGTLDTHTATIDWGDGTTGTATIAEQSGAGTASASHVYLEEGVFHALLTVTDNGNASST